MKNETFKKLINAVNAHKESAYVEDLHETTENLIGVYNWLWSEIDRNGYDSLTEKQKEKIEIVSHEIDMAIHDNEVKEKGGKQMPKNEVETKPEVETVPEETKPEVLTGEVVPAIDAKTVKTVEAAIDRVSKKLVTISNGYLSIVGDVAHLYDLKAWEVTKHNNIYEMCENKFDGMARGTVNNLLSIFKRFGDKENYKLTAEAFNEDGSPRSVRSLLEQIKTEKKALKAEKNGGAIGDGEGNGEGNGDGEDTKKKAETLANISFDIIGGEWDAEAIAEELKKAIEKAQADLSQDCTITLTITRQ